MHYQEIIPQLENRERFGFKFGLSRIRKFLEYLNHPEKNLRIVHITGTNGKGSTAVFIAKILEFAGYRVGLYTSPHLLDIRERIQINSAPISKNDFVSLYHQLSTVNRKLSQELTYFEFLTALAFQHFFEKKVDFLVLEVGLGGRLDATNVIRKPLVSLITNIDYEHTEYLGKSLQKIAYEKAGIIKRNSITVTGIRQKNLLSLLKEICLQRKNRLFCLGKDFQFKNSEFQNPTSQFFDYKGIFNNYKNLRIKLLGKHQIDNACLAIATTEVLKFHGTYVSEYAIREGLWQTFWPGRLEIFQLVPRPSCPVTMVRGEPRPLSLVTIVLDGAHNPAGIDVLKESLSSLFPKKKIVLILGILADKDIGQMIKKIASASRWTVDEVILTKPNYYRAAEPEILHKEMRKYLADEKIFLHPRIKEALNFAFSRINKRKNIIVVTGSLYTIAEVKKVTSLWKRKLTLV